jgi:hypothetical protein
MSILGTIVISIILLVVFYKFMSGFLESGPEYIALDQVKSLVDDMCDPYNPSIARTVNIFIPDSSAIESKYIFLKTVNYYGIKLTSDEGKQYLELRYESGTDDGNRPGTNKLKKVEITCPNYVVTLNVASLEADPGKESFNIRAEKNEENKEIALLVEK